MNVATRSKVWMAERVIAIRDVCHGSIVGAIIDRHENTRKV